MRIFRDQLPAAIRIRKRFAPSPDRVRASRNLLLEVFCVLLGLTLLALYFSRLVP